VHVLRQIGDVSVVKTGNEAEETTRPLRILQVIRLVRRALRQDPDLIVFEVSGAALAELLAAGWSILMRRNRRFAVWITIHDSPAVTGGLFWVGWLRKRGLRRIASFLSKHVGFTVERWVLDKADIVVCLTSVGAKALEEAYALRCPVEAIHFVADVAEQPPDRRQAFLPGPVQLDAASEVLTAIAATNSDFEVLVGFCDAHTQEELQQRAARLGIDAKLRFAGFVDQKQLVEAYRSSMVVVHWYAKGDPRCDYANRSACSGPAVDAIAAGSVLVTNAARGAGEYVAESSAAYDLVGSHESLGDVLAVLLSSPQEAEQVGHRALAYARRTLSVLAVAEEVKARLEKVNPGVLVV